MGRNKRRPKKKPLPLFVLVLALLLSAFVFYRLTTAEQVYDSPYTGLSYTTPAPVRAVGIDVSQHQEEIDWEAVAADGIAFAFIRGAYRGTATGALAVDTEFFVNIEEAQAAGIKVGVYIFSQAITAEEAEEEAAFLISLVLGYDLDLPLVLDYEFDEDHTGRLAAAKLSKTEKTDIVLAFCQYVTAKGYSPAVYGNAHMLKEFLETEKIQEKAAIWYANYNDRALREPYDFWQYTESATVAGISGPVDCNLAFTKLRP